MRARLTTLAAAAALVAGCNLIFGIQGGTPAGDGGVPGGDGGPCLPQRTVPCAASLTDPQNCCTEGRSCQGATCMGGECGPVLVSAEPTENVVDVIVIGEQVVWSSGATGNLYTIPAAGGARTVIGSTAGSTLLEIGDLATDGTYVYFTDTQTPAVGRIPLAGGKAEIVAQLSSSDVIQPGEPLEIAVGGGKVYWAASATGIMYAPIAGPFPAKPHTLFTAQNSYGVSADDTYVYLADPMGGSMYRLAHAKVGTGAHGEPIATTTGTIGYITNDTGSVLWAEDNTVKLVPKAGGKPFTVTTESADTPANYIFADGRDVYWTTVDVGCSGLGGAVRRTSQSGGGAIVTLATNKTQMDGIAGTCDTVYWLDDQKTSLMKATK